MFCSQCGKKLKDNMLFCPNCGVAIEFFDEDDEVSAVETSAEVENRPAESMEQSVQREEIVPDEQEELVLFEEESVQPQETETVMLREEAVPVPEMPPIKRDRKDENETVVSVFDEPEAGIDLWSFQNLIQVFEEMHNQLHGSILIISHQERILNIADKIIMIADGQVQKEGTKEEILPQLLGTSSAADFACTKMTGKE